tara:strand:+ start:729 stop:923 length:195 start_codon:yes stop_codon:yes gene_type:complete
MMTITQKLVHAVEAANIPKQTLRTWKKRGFVPAARHQTLVEVSQGQDFELSYEELNGREIFHTT